MTKLSKFKGTLAVKVSVFYDFYYSKNKQTPKKPQKLVSMNSFLTTQFGSL